MNFNHEFWDKYVTHLHKQLLWYLISKGFLKCIHGQYNWPLNIGLNCVGPLTCWFFSINTVQYYKCTFSSLGLFNNLFFSLAYFTVRTQYVIPRTYRICVNQLFMLLVRLLVNRRLLVVKFWGSQKLYTDFQPHRGGGDVWKWTLSHLLERPCQEVGSAPSLTPEARIRSMTWPSL